MTNIGTGDVRKLPRSTCKPKGELGMSIFGGMANAGGMFTVNSATLVVSRSCPEKRPRIIRPTVRRTGLLIRGLGGVRGKLPLGPFICRGGNSVTAIKEGGTVIRLGGVHFNNFPT